MAEDAWNSRNPELVSMVYAPDTYWRNRNKFIHGRQEVVNFLTKKWQKELEYRLIKELWTYDRNKNEGLMINRYACINDLCISEDERAFFWPLGRGNGL